MSFEIKISIIEVGRDNRSLVRDTRKVATVDSLAEAKLLVEYSADQVKHAQPFARPLPVE